MPRKPSLVALFSLLSLILIYSIGMNAFGSPLEENEEFETMPEGAPSFSNLLQVHYKTVDDFMKGVIPSFLANNNGVGIAIGVIQSGKPQTFYFGETVKGSSQRPNGSTLFMIGSVSKTFAATLLALDVEKGLVHLSDPLQNFVPEGVSVPTYNNDTSHPITLEALATHTSGLPRKPPIQPSGGKTTVEQLFQSLNQTSLGSTPGDKYLYSNFGFSLLGQALARAENKTWASLNLQEIDAPLGLTDTKVESQLGNGELNRRAQGYFANGMPAPYGTPGFPAGNPAGGLYSSMDDMMKYLSFAIGLSNTPLNSLRTALFTPLHMAGPNGKVGLAWQMNPLQGTNYRVIWKNGSVPGFVSYIGFIPEARVGVVVLMNSLNKQANALGVEILRFLIQMPASVSLPTQPLLQNNPQLPGPGPVENQEK